MFAIVYDSPIVELIFPQEFWATKAALSQQALASRYRQVYQRPAQALSYKCTSRRGQKSSCRQIYNVGRGRRRRAPPRSPPLCSPPPHSAPQRSPRLHSPPPSRSPPPPPPLFISAAMTTPCLEVLPKMDLGTWCNQAISL